MSLPVRALLSLVFTACTTQAQGAAPAMVVETPADPVVVNATPTAVVVEQAENPVLVAQQAPESAGFAAVLATYTTPDGGFRYTALQQHAEHLALLDAWIAYVAVADTNAMSRDERLAFYINAYNALVVRDVITLWPVTSVLEETGFFDVRSHRIAGETLTLNQLENDRIRTMGEARIHFLVNCASVGCPRLIAELVTSANLESLLAAQTREFVSQHSILRRESATVEISQIFEWFAGDFDSSGGVRAFVASQLDAESAAFVLDPSTSIAFTPYNWAVNAR
jgi:hypothetical protein